MFFPGRAKDEDIVDVTDATNIDQPGQHLIHSTLKNGGAICHAHRQDFELK